MTSNGNLDLPKKGAPTVRKSVDELSGINSQESEIWGNKERTNHTSASDKAVTQVPRRTKGSNSNLKSPLRAL